MGKGERWLYGGYIGCCGVLLFTVGDEAKFSANWLRGFDETPVLIDQRRINLNCVEVLGGPVYGTLLVSNHHLLVSVWIHLMEGNKIDGVSQEVLPSLTCITV